MKSLRVECITHKQIYNQANGKVIFLKNFVKCKKYLVNVNFLDVYLYYAEICFQRNKK